MTTVAIVVAAGSGTRMGADMPKALIPLAGRPLVAWSIWALNASDRVDGIVVVAPPGHERPMGMALGETAELLAMTTGGSSRGRSVAAGLGEVPEGADRILVHDAARPLLSPDHISMVLAGIEDADGAIIAAPAADTIKRTDDDLHIVETIDRSVHWLAQTPQAFRTESFARAIEVALEGDYIDTCTDCAAMVEAMGGAVRVVPSVLPNQKVTTPSDLEIVAQLLEARNLRA
ncbi:MAG: 2-C-methyl-D-erythritol 4-phosphate cytidylyltransferase [Thermoleophilia bacterium]|nr:2-C-methyl-D-erythritol 4-phosphate cytidylyltransferase [Thermoleophilia bacterium]MDH3724402.1 2-C-methyl-D-erythritol 4-phosphate cytidylyltransferase [Thermoleophilia bacterium]